jgi:hypothetical protein
VSNISKGFTAAAKEYGRKNFEIRPLPKMFSWSPLVTPEEVQKSIINDPLSLEPKARAYKFLH